MTGFMVPGSPYMTFNFTNATPKLTSAQGSITSFAGTTVGGTAGKASYSPPVLELSRMLTGNIISVSSTGTSFNVINNVGTYRIYSLSGSLTLSATGTTIVASSAFTGVLRMVKLNSTSHQALLDQYSGNYATAVTTDYSFSGDNANLIFTWNVIGSANDLLMLTWPHHR